MINTSKYKSSPAHGCEFTLAFQLNIGLTIACKQDFQTNS